MPPEPNKHRRLWLIELLAYWEGGINSRHLMGQFGISRQQASGDINAYREQFPDNLSYHRSHKCYQPTGRFLLGYIRGDVDEYLDWRHGIWPPQTAIPETEQIDLPQRQVRPEIIRALVSAMREQRAVDVDYVSVTKPDRDGRNIVPHTFIKAGPRWHLRAYCEKHQAYRDFVLSRFRGIPELLGPSAHGAAQDRAWNTDITLAIRPDFRLSDAQKAVVEQDYQMEHGELKIVTRAALATYLLKELQINYKLLAGDPAEQQLVLVNQDDIKEWLF